MKRIFSIAAMAVALMPVAAQDTYENANVLGGDLNGTARYVGMGGALEALGADISTISTNPAGIGLFSHSNVSLSAGLVSQQGAEKFADLNKTNASFDQAGFVWANIAGPESGVNFAFNFHKSRNFDRILKVNNQLRGASLSKLAYGKSQLGSEGNGGYDIDHYTYENGDEAYMGFVNSTSNSFAYPFTQWDYLYTNGMNIDDVNAANWENTYSEADSYFFDKANSGWIADFDFNLSGNVNNRFFWGFTIGLHSVKYKGYSVYDEMMVNTSDMQIGRAMLEDEHRIDGSGFDFKLGFIFRPIEESPFRIGLSVATPTWYSLTSENTTVLYNNTYTYDGGLGYDFSQMLPSGMKLWGYDWFASEYEFDYKYYTPWKFGFSLGHTISDFLALGASYEFSDYGSASTRLYDGTRDYYGNKNTEKDAVMTRDTENKLKGVHLLKVGAEFKPDPSLGVRLGYNYQTTAYKKDAFRDTQLASPGVKNSSTPDFVNWDDTHRITAGIGYKYEGLSIDLAYQYSITKGTFHPFQSNVVFQDGTIDYNDGRGPQPFYETCVATPTKFDFKRHQVLLTLGYTF